MRLRSYQRDIADNAVSLLDKYNIAYLAMEMRTGKTITSLAAAEKYGAKKILFITKKKAIKSIEDDAALFNLSVEVINYEALHKCSNDFDLAIIDECHSLSQFPKPSIRTENLKRICFQKPIIFLSGTPSPESYSQFYHQFWVSSSSPWKVYKNFYSWFKDYGVLAQKFIYNRQINDYSGGIKNKIINDIKHLMITFSQEEAGFKSLIREEVIDIDMPEVIRVAIKKIKANKILTAKDGGVIIADTAAKEMQKVHQLCGGTVKYDEGGTGKIIDTKKIEVIKEKFGGKKIAIFYKFILEGQALREAFAGNYYLSPEQFNLATTGVFISQIISGREGVNLSTADAIVMYNIDYSAVSYWQGRARMQTKDSERVSKIYWLFFRGGIEKDIYKVVKSKKKYTTIHYKKSSSFTLF